MFKRILIPLDGSRTAERILPKLDFLCTRETVRHLVTVVPCSAAGNPAPDDQVRLLEAESYLSFLQGEPGGGARAEVRRGDVLGEILSASATAGADLIALSSHGESARLTAPFGSIAGRVLVAATCPVLTVGAFAEETAGPTGRPTRILVPLDGSRESEASLVPARRAAAEWKAEVVLLHVIEPLWAAADSAAAQWRARETEATHRRLLELVEGLKREGIGARALLSHGEAAGSILEQVVRRRAGLLCMTTAGRGTVGRLFFGATAQKLIGVLPVPAIMVRVAPPRPS